MLKTQLSVDYSTSLNLKVLRLYDTSHYCLQDTIENYLLEVLPANSKKWVTFHVEKGFSMALNSSNLRYHVISEEAQLLELPDGIYEFKLSYKPNILNVCQFYHMRITDLVGKIKTERKKLLEDQCSLSREEFWKSLHILRDIEDFATSAQYMVEECLDKQKGLEAYKWAVKRLEDYTNECKC